MIDPVILPDAILNQAKLWHEKCRRRWTDAAGFIRIGETTLVSPVDNKPRKVVLYLDGTFILKVKAKTFIRILSETGEDLGEGYTIVLNRGLIDVEREPLMPILLHEMTHAVDPRFDEDIRRQDVEGRLTEAEDLYGLPSEQRAFTAMWTADLQEALARGEYLNPGVSILTYRNRSPEFKGFWDNCSVQVADQTKEHFRLIVADLKRRQRTDI